MANPAVSLIVPVYNVAQYLPDFLDSLHAQDVDPASLEVVFVDDGSPDESNPLIARWIEDGHPFAKLVVKENGGLASARNRGLDEATGEWVSFPDPDDVLGPGYLRIVQEFLASPEAGPAHLLATNLLYLEDATGEILDRHPLRFKFADGQQTVDLAQVPHFIHLQAASAFYRRSLIEQFGLRFDGRVRPTFEDGALTALYLAHFDHPTLAVLPAAQYRYRRRSDGSSLVQGSWAKPEKYTDLLRYGHLLVLETIRAQRGRIPRWAQNLILYELTYYFRHDAAVNAPTAGISAETSAEFHLLLEQILDLIDPETIAGFAVTKSTPEIRTAMLLCRTGAPTRPDRVLLDRLDRDQHLVRASYYFTGDSPADRPSETFRGRGRVVAPVHQKVRTLRFLGATMAYQRIVWLPADGTVSVEVDGRRMLLDVADERGDRYEVTRDELWTALAGRTAPAAVPPPADTRRGGRLQRVRSGLHDPRGSLLWARRRLGERAAMLLARSPVGRLRFRDAWLLMDRDDQAQDNAEHLYRYLRAHQPAVNAWFVLSRSSTSWKRLEDEGFRLIEHGRMQHKVALLNCVHLISSQVDHYVVAPLKPARFGPPRWRFTFLQHGVIKDDLSAWLNSKPIARMLTSTPAEQDSIAGDGTNYVFTTKEMALTGLPRHDRLLELGRAQPAGERKLVLVTPTWRNNLLLQRVRSGNARVLRHDFWETDYAVSWRKVLESERLSKLAAEHGWEIMFVPHPNMQDYLRDTPLPESVSVRRFSEVDIQALLARAGVMLTDYSSMAFEMAYLERPVVYFQFDQAEFYAGTHVYRKGYWDYERDGFGPVTVDADRAVDEVSAVILRGGAAEPGYARRMAETFPFRDGRCCERTYESICEITRRPADEELYGPRD